MSKYNQVEAMLGQLRDKKDNVLKELQGLANICWLELEKSIWDWILKVLCECGWVVQKIKLDKEEFITKRTLLYTTAFNIQGKNNNRKSG